MPIAKKLGHIMDFAIFHGNSKISEHASLTAAKKKAREITGQIRQWNEVTKHWKQI